MKKTLLITLDFPPNIGGIAVYYKNICENLPIDAIHVLAPDIPYHEIFDSTVKYAIHRKKMISSSFFAWPKWKVSIQEAQNIIKKENIQALLVGNILPCGTVAFILKMKLNIPYYIFIHGMDVSMIRGRKKILAKKIMKNASIIFSNSNFTKHTIESFGISQEKIITVYPCPNPLPQADDLEIITLRNAHGLHDKKILLTVGRLVERKGHDMVLKAMAEVVKKYENTVYIIAGSGPNKENLKNMVHGLRLEDNVIFVENASDKEISALYELCDIFIMASRQLDNNDYEGFGIVYLEANLFSKPVIAGRSGGVTEAVINSINGILVNPTDTKEISSSIIYLFDNPHQAHILGMQGMDRVKHKFQWWEQAKKIENIL